MRPKITSFVGLFTLLLMTLVNTGCVYIPPLGLQFTDEKRDAIVVQKTKRDEIINLLGRPDALESERFFVYQVSREYGHLVLLAPYPGPGILPLAFPGKYFTVLIEFDEQSIVKRYEIESNSGAFSGGPVTDVNSSGDSLWQHELLFTAEAKDIFGSPVGIDYSSVAISRNGKLVGVGGAKLVGGNISSKRIWIKNLETGQLRIIETDSYDRLAFSPDFAEAALLKRSVKLIDLNNGKTLSVYKGHGDSSFWSTRGAFCLAFDPKSKAVATGGYKGHIKIWDSHSGNEFKSFSGHDGTVTSIVYSPDGSRLATSGADKTVKLWETKTGRQLCVLTEKEGVLRFSPNGETLIIHRGNFVELWHLKSMDGCDEKGLLMTLDAVFLVPHSTLPYQFGHAVDISRNGKLVAASNGGMVVYDLEQSRKRLRVSDAAKQATKAISLNSDRIASLAFSPDGKSLVVGTAAGVFVWSIPPELN